jgi:cytochrome P450
MPRSAALPYGDYIHAPNNERLDGIPGDEGLPFVGHSLRFYRDPYDFAAQQYRRYGAVFRLRVTGGRGVVALGPELMERIYLDPGRDFSSRMGFMARVATFFGDSLIMEDFEHHRHQRRIMQSAFRTDALRHYTAEINAICARTLDAWEREAGRTVPFFQLAKSLLLEIAAKVFIGEQERGENFRRLNKGFSDCLAGLMYLLPVDLPGFTYHRGLAGKRFLQQYFGELVRARRDGNGQDMLSHFCRERDEDGELFSDAEVVNQGIFLLFAAHDTTTAALTHTVYYLARHPQVREQLRRELAAPAADALAYDELGSLPFAQQVFFEVQRLRPSAPVVPRRTIREVELSGVRVPAHTMVYTVPRFTHHMEQYWREPARFDPDRFGPGRAEHKQHPFLFHPFGGGAHKCIGMHFAQLVYKCFLYQFLRRFDFEARHRGEPFMQTLPLPKPADDMPVVLVRR